MNQDGLFALVVGAPIFLFAIVLHEVAHGWVAEKLGDPTARRAGRLTLNPIPHIDPLGAIMFVVSSLMGFGFGWAKPVPINPYNFRRPRRDMMLTGIAGPLANFLQILGWGALLLLFRARVPLSDPQLYLLVVRILWLGVWINGILLVFNLIPVPPLDGSRLLAWLLPEHQAQSLDRLEPFGFIIVLALLYFGVFGAVFGPVYGLLANLFLR